MTESVPPPALSALDRKLLLYFPGLVVRKDLSKGLKQNAVVPTYVLEYLLGQHCATDDRAAIDAGLLSVQRILAKHYVQRNQAELVKSTIKEKGRHKVIDKLLVELNDKGGFYEAKYRYAPYNPPYYAIWSLPAQKQESVFGAVIIEGEPLAEYCAWEASLDDELRKRWLDALDVLASAKDAAAAYAVMAELAKEHPIPVEVARWISERAGQPIPEGIRARAEAAAPTPAASSDAGDQPADASTPAPSTKGNAAEG